MGCIIILAHYGMATEQFIVLWDGTVAKQTYQGFIQVSVGCDKCIGPVTFVLPFCLSCFACCSHLPPYLCYHLPRPCPCKAILYWLLWLPIVYNVIMIVSGFWGDKASFSSRWWCHAVSGRTHTARLTAYISMLWWKYRWLSATTSWCHTQL